jgi:hypothetical protein
MKATEKIKKAFSSVFGFDDWLIELDHWLSWKDDLISNEWFLAMILSQPVWSDFFVFSCAVEVIVKKNPDLVDDPKFNEIVEDNKPLFVNEITAECPESKELQEELVGVFDKDVKNKIYARIENLKNHKSLVSSDEKIPF